MRTKSYGDVRSATSQRRGQLLALSLIGAALLLVLAACAPGGSPAAPAAEQAKPTGAATAATQPATSAPAATAVPTLLPATATPAKDAVVVAGQGSGDAANGKQFWAQRNCKGCHGDNGEGKFAGPRAGDGRSAADWIKQVRTPRANMPAYSTAQISDTVITDMNAYMQTLPKPASLTPMTTTVTASDPAGLQLMAEKRCYACHGNGQGLVKARFVDQNREITTEVLLKQLRTPARFMPSYSATQVTDAQAAQIADYMKTLAAAIKASTPVTPTATAATPAAAKGQAEAGMGYAKQFGCVGCHSVDGSAMAGPTFKGLYGSNVDLEGGASVKADDAYLQESIQKPNAKIVKSFFAGIMPDLGSGISDQQAQALVEYIKTLR